jgi:hypothetical protein
MTFDELVASNAALSGEVRRSHEALRIAQLTIDKMKVELAYLRRMKYGRSSERLEQPQPQLELVGGQVAQLAVAPSLQGEVDEVDALKSNVTSLEKERSKRQPKPRPGLREMPEHLPRRTVVHTPSGGEGACDAKPAAPACARSARMSRRSWTTNPAPSTSCATFARSWPARAAARSRRRWHRAGRWTGAWPAPDCSRTSW